ncbi:hypothetical protein GCM10010274_56610 [Streptomyces lavendofoliae]|uniref:Uncharacterized protein n=1 Tax=Streptomyces lavendofoliae TaxID=67314 RepID=A0A918M7P3_9ACTN|nr:hypothetical protein GCM10010274_56610 [Streptomyces lavendofoliae]
MDRITARAGNSPAGQAAALAADAQSPLKARARNTPAADGRAGPGAYGGGGGGPTGAGPAECGATAGGAGGSGVTGGGGEAGGGGAASLSRPQVMQKRASSGEGVPQCGQFDAMDAPGDGK